MSDNRSTSFLGVFIKHGLTVFGYLLGIAGAYTFVLFSLWASGHVAKLIDSGMLEGGTFWLVFVATFAPTGFILFLLWGLRMNVEAEGWEYIKKLRAEVAKVTLSSNHFADSIIPSFISTNGQLPVQPEILTQLRQDVARLQCYIEGAELFRRHIVCFSETTSDMLADFFGDPFLADKRIEQIRFLGTGRGAFGPVQSSYHFFQHFTDFLLQGQRPLFRKYMIIGPSGVPDHFCMRYFILRLVVWVADQRANLSMPTAVSIEAVYPQTDAFPSLLVLGNEKVLLSYSIGHVDGGSIGLAVPMGIQISQDPVTLPSRQEVSLSTSIHRIRDHFDATFGRGGLTPEVWRIDSGGQIYLENFNLDVTVHALDGVTGGTVEERAKVRELCQQLAQRSLDPRRAEQRVLQEEYEFLEQRFWQYSNQEL